MNKQHPTPKVSAAHMAMYGKPADDTTQRIIELYRGLSSFNQHRVLLWTESVANGDQTTADQIKKNIESDLVYLQRISARGEA